MYRTHTCGQLRIENKGQVVTLAGGLVLLAVLCSACSEKFETADTTKPRYSEHIPYSEAVNSLQVFIDGLNATKAGKEWALADTSSFTVRTTPCKSTTTTLAEDFFYVINFGDDNGYAVLSANKKIGMDVVCLTEKGHLNQNHFSKAEQVINAGTYNQEEIPAIEDDSDTTFIPEVLLSAALERMANVIAPSDWEIIGGGPSGIVAPLLKTKWGQINPFNTYVPTDCPTGCVPTAIAQIMAFEEHSSTMVFDGVTCIWSEMKTVRTYPNVSSDGTSDGREQVARFLKALGAPANCNVSYSPNGSGAYDIRAKITLQNYGYSNVQLHYGFTFNNDLRLKVSQQLLYGHPAYVSGTTNDNKGHAWVVDGYYVNTYHINWGWYGDGDGFFNAGIFDLSQRTGVSSYDNGEPAYGAGPYVKYYYVITYETS